MNILLVHERWRDEINATSPSRLLWETGVGRLTVLKSVLKRVISGCGGKGRSPPQPSSDERKQRLVGFTAEPYGGVSETSRNECIQMIPLNAFTIMAFCRHTYIKCFKSLLVNKIWIQSSFYDTVPFLWQRLNPNSPTSSGGLECKYDAKTHIWVVMWVSTGNLKLHYSPWAKQP